MRDQWLCIVFGLVFLVTLTGRALCGVADYNERGRNAGLQQVSQWRYPTSSRYPVDVAEN